jgi:SAM-dependent methyltransferase
MSWGKIYSSKYDYYDYLEPHESIDLIISYFRNVQVKRILDLGCGVGRNMAPLLKAGFDVVGLDSSSVGIKAAEKRMIAKFFCQDMFDRLPFPSENFDAVVAIQTI